MIPILMITWNRLEYTKKALTALLECRHALVIIIDNGSTDGTMEWLMTKPFGLRRPMMYFNHANMGIAHAMNKFLYLTRNYDIVGKVDNDTIVSEDWIEKMLPYLKHADIIQSKHHIIESTCQGGWDQFIKPMKFKNGLYYNHYVGGSGILFKRKIVESIKNTENKIMGWREWQRENSHIVKAFVPDVEIKLLDEHGYEDYPEYYKQTGRI